MNIAVGADIGTTLQLYVGRKFSGISLRAEPQCPGLWRVHHNGWVSDILNLTRAKAIARSMASAGGTEVLHWRNRQSPAEASPMRFPLRDASQTVFGKQTAPRASAVKVIAGPVETYSERSLWKALPRCKP